MDFTTVIAAPAIAAMHEHSAIHGKDQDLKRDRVHTIHPLQENLMRNWLAVDCKIENHEVQTTSHPNPIQQKLMRRLFSTASDETRSTLENLEITDPRPLRQQPEPLVRVSLRKRITDSANYTWKCEMSEEGAFEFEEVL